MYKSEKVLPGKHEIGIGIVGARASWAPFYSVNFFAVGLQVMNARVLLHTPDLKQHKHYNFRHLIKDSVAVNTCFKVCLLSFLNMT